MQRGRAMRGRWGAGRCGMQWCHRAEHFLLETVISAAAEKHAAGALGSPGHLGCGKPQVKRAVWVSCATAARRRFPKTAPSARRRKQASLVATAPLAAERNAQKGKSVHICAGFVDYPRHAAAQARCVQCGKLASGIVGREPTICRGEQTELSSDWHAIWSDCSAGRNGRDKFGKLSGAACVL